MQHRSSRSSLDGNRTELSDAMFYCGKKNTKALSMNPSWFLDRTIECGLATKKFIASSLHIPSGAIRSLLWNRDYFELRTSIPGISRCMLKKFKPAERAKYLRVGVCRVVNDLVLIIPDVIQNPRVELFLDRASKVLAMIEPNTMFTVLYNDTHDRIVVFGVSPRDAQLRAPRASATQHDHQRVEGPDRNKGPRADRDRIARSEFPYFEWGNEHLQNIFMFTPMMRARVPFSGIRTERMREIVHGDNECVYMSDRPDPLHFIGIVDMGALKESAVLFERKNISVTNNMSWSAAPDHAGGPVSILYDEDVIQGGTTRLKQLLHAMAKTGTTSDLLVNCTCTPLIIGDDVRSVIKNVNMQKHTSFLYCDAVKQNASDIYLEYAKTLFARLSRYAPTPGMINLVGFPQVSGVAELIPALGILGITINTAVLPRIGPSNCEEYYKGQLQVFFPNVDNMNLYKDVFFPVERPYIIVDAPYGFKRTTAWVEGICHNMQITPSSNVQWQVFYAAKCKEWTCLIQEARRFSLGMVVTPEDISRLCAPASCVAGLPLIPFLEEMGFVLDICIYCPEERYADLRKKIMDLFSCAEGHRINTAFGAKAVRKWLHATESVCIYSDLLVDKRLSRAGKTRFSIADLEMGFDGAIRTIQRLLAKCRTVFYARYCDYFEGSLRPVICKEL